MDGGLACRIDAVARRGAARRGVAWRGVVRCVRHARQLDHQVAPELIRHVMIDAAEQRRHVPIGNKLGLDLTGIQVLHCGEHRGLDEVLHHRAQPLLQPQRQVVLNALGHDPLVHRAEGAIGGRRSLEAPLRKARDHVAHERRDLGGGRARGKREPGVELMALVLAGHLGRRRLIDLVGERHAPLHCAKRRAGEQAFGCAENLPRAAHHSRHDRHGSLPTTARAALAGTAACTS